jgi:U5 small nuclear ribonucleoprotein component
VSHNVTGLPPLSHETHSELCLPRGREGPGVANTEVKRERAVCGFMDSTDQEQARAMTVRLGCYTAVLPGWGAGYSGAPSARAHHAVHLCDLPGHASLAAEFARGLALADTVLIAVCCIEGVTETTRRQIRTALLHRRSLLLVITKLDRLITESRLPPADAEAKMVAIIDECNDVAMAVATGRDATEPFCPRRGSVAFASSEHGYLFTLHSFARLHLEKTVSREFASDDDAVDDLAHRLWGDWVLDAESGRIVHADRYRGPAAPRAFTALVLTPLYKLVTAALALTEEQYLFARDSNGGDGTGEDDDEDEENAIAAEKREVLATLAALTDAERAGLGSRELVATVVERALGGPAGLAWLVGSVGGPVAEFTGAAGGSGGDGNGNGNGNGDGDDDGGVGLLSRHFARGADLGDGRRRISPRDAELPLVGRVVKLFRRPGEEHDGPFDALVRIDRGTARAGAVVRVAGEAFPEDPEDVRTETITRVLLPMTRYNIDASEVGIPCGSWALIEGIGEGLVTTGTVWEEVAGGGAGGAGGAGGDDSSASFPVYPPLAPCPVPHLRLPLEPLRPPDLPRLAEAMRRVARSHSGIATAVEESGEHAILACGELALDVAMYDLTVVFARVELRVGDASCTLRETVAGATGMGGAGGAGAGGADHLALPGGTAATVASANGKSTITIASCALGSKLTDQLESGAVTSKMPRGQLSGMLRTEHGWDVLAARGIWAFGAGCALVDERIADMDDDDDDDDEDDDDQANANGKASGAKAPAAIKLDALRPAVVRGFRWAVRQGPICEEPMRQLRVRIIDSTLSTVPAHLGSGQIIPMTRKAVHASVMVQDSLGASNARLMEPVMEWEATVSGSHSRVVAIGKILGGRRGRVLGDAKVGGTPFTRVWGTVPALDGMGLETDVRIATGGMLEMRFGHWGVVPGDPLDRRVGLPGPLEPAGRDQLARELAVKIRRRKGLAPLP